MRNIFKLVLLSFLLSFSFFAKAQVSGYSFSSSSGTYSAITGGTVLITGTSSMDSWVSSAITIPSFTFNCVSYTTAYVTSNGQLSFGGSAPSAYTYTGISTGVGSGICICPFSADLDDATNATTSEIRWQTVGNEVIFQWTKMCRYGVTESFDFQIRLNTSTNVIKFVYQLNSGPGSSTSYQPEVGIRTSATDYKNLQISTGAETWIAPLAGTANTNTCRFTSTAVAKSFTTGRTYTWTPPASCSGTPAPGSTVASANPVCSGVAFSLSMSTPPSGCGITYQWQYSSDNVTWNNITGATSATYSATQSAATYYRCLVTCTNSALFAYSTAVYVTINPPTSCYCVNTNTTNTSYYISNFTATGTTTINNTTGFSTSGYGNYTAMSVTQMQSSSVSFSITETGGTMHFGIWVDWNDDGDFADSGEEVYYNSTYNSTVSSSFTVPITAAAGSHRMRVVGNESGTVAACTGSAYTECEDYTIIVTALPNCSGTPTGGTASATTTSGCSGYTSTLSVSSSTVASGITYQWQSSPDNVTWTNIAGATGATYVPTVTSNLYYRRVITCSNSGLSSNSSSVLLSVNSFYSCYCASSATSTSDMDITKITFGTINNTSATVSLTGSQGTATGTAGMYSNWTASAVPIPSVMQGSTNTFSVTIGGTAYSHQVMVYFDFNHNGAFTDAGESFAAFAYANPTLPNTTSVSITIPLTATTGTTGMRIVCVESSSVSSCGTYSWGETEDYLVNITAAPACTGTPTGGTAAATATSGCSGYTSTLSVTGSSIASGLTYQWQSSPDNVTWTNIAGATSLTYTPTVTTNLYYRRVITCTSSGLSANSSSVYLTVNSFLLCYCTSGATNTSDMDITKVAFGTINNTSATVSLTGTQGTATGTAGEYSDWRASTVPVPSVMQGSTTTFSVTIGGTAYSHQVAVYIDFNHNSIFTDAGETFNVFAYANPTLPNTTSISITVPITATIGNTVMRVVCVESSSISSCGTYSWGETEDYIINITAAPACTGTPTGGTTVATPSSGCSGYSSTLTVTGSTIASGLTYQWQSSPDNVTWTNISGATSETYTPTVTSNMYYRRIIACTSSGLSANSSSIYLTINSFLLCYCTSSATNTSDMDITNITFGTINNSSAAVSLTGTQGTATGTAGMYSDWRSSTVPVPSFMQGTTNTFSVTVGGTAYSHQVAVYIDFNQDGDFTDSGEEFSVFAYANPTLPNTTSVSITIPLSALTGNTGMRVVCVESSSISCCGTYSWGETEDYIINITTAPPCSGTPTGGTTTASTTSVSGCTGYYGAISVTGSTVATGLTYQWYSSATGSAPWTLIAGATGATYTPTTTGLYYMRITTCTASGGSANSSTLLYTSSAPANDECENAITITANSSSTCTSTGSGSVACATPSANATACTSGSDDDDVWFKFVATNSNHTISILNAAGSVTDMYFSVYSGTCGALTSLACSDADALSLGYLSVGSTYYIRVYTYTATTGQTTTFNVCVSSPDADAICDNARPFCSDTTYNFPTNTNAGTAPAGISYGCLCQQPNPIWYYMKIGTAGPIELTIQSSCGDVDYAAWGPFTTTACDSLTDSGTYDYGGSTSSSCSVDNFESASGQMIDCAYSTASIEYLTIPSSVVNTFYLVMINNYANCAGTYTFHQTSGTGKTNCAIVVPLPVGLYNFTSKCNSENEVQLDWTTFTQYNNDYFEVQRMINGTFEIIGIVDGAGNSNEMVHYSFTDYTSTSSVQYYRLRQVDFDGSAENLKTIPVDCNGELAFNIISSSMDATSGNLEINFNGLSDQEYQINLMDLSGKVIFNDSYTATIDGKNQAISYFKPVAQGVYVVSLTNKSGITIFAKVAPR